MPLTNQGFQRKTYDDILTEQSARARLLFGDDIDVSEQSVFGKILRLYCLDASDNQELAEGFDEEKDNNYISRAERAEWAAVGLLGKLVVRDDGSCEVNGFCYPKKNGIATASAEGYRVMKRIDKNHVKVLVK